MDNQELSLEKQIAAIVEDLLTEKEEATLRANIESELQKAAAAVSELTEALEVKNSEVAEFEATLASTIEEKDLAIATLTSELEAAKSELEEANTKATEVAAELEGLRKDRAAELRMAELEDAGVARSDKDTQMAKVREMSEEDFASYKDELVSVREAVIAELDKARQASEEAAANAQAEEANVAEESQEEAASEGETQEEAAVETETEEASTEDTEIEVEEPSTAVASLNIESRARVSVSDKYKEMGKAMAEMLKTLK